MSIDVREKGKTTADKNRDFFESRRNVYVSLDDDCVWFLEKEKQRCNDDGDGARLAFSDHKETRKILSEQEKVVAVLFFTVPFFTHKRNEEQEKKTYDSGILAWDEYIASSSTTSYIGSRRVTDVLGDHTQREKK